LALRFSLFPSGTSTSRRGLGRGVLRRTNVPSAPARFANPCSVPHPAFGHPLPARRGEGLFFRPVRGANRRPGPRRSLLLPSPLKYSYRVKRFAAGSRRFNAAEKTIPILSRNYPEPASQLRPREAATKKAGRWHRAREVSPGPKAWRTPIAARQRKPPASDGGSSARTPRAGGPPCARLH
jgi:hypothetical protein